MEMLANDARTLAKVWRVSGPRLHWRSGTRLYTPLVHGIVQAAITTAVATAIATLQLTDFNMRFVEEWLLAWGIAFLTMLPVVVFVAPLIQRGVLGLTASTSRDALN